MGTNIIKLAVFCRASARISKISEVNYNLIEFNKLSKYSDISKGAFSRKTGDLKAVNDVSYHFTKAESLGIIAESGSGKTILGKNIIRAIQPTHSSIL